MFDFSDDEWVFLLVVVVGAVFGAWRWYSSLMRISPLNADKKSQWLLLLAPLASLVFLTLVLQTLADPVYVAGHFDYTLLFLAGGAVWIFGAAGIFSVMGVSVYDDA